MDDDQPNEIEQDVLIYSINEDQNPASVSGVSSDLSNVNVPRSLKYESKECIITHILTSGCSYSDVTAVEFAANSELQIIEDRSFEFSQIASITIPSSVTQICESAFSSCGQFVQVEFQQNSKLRTIEKSAFYGSQTSKHHDSIKRD